MDLAAPQNGAPLELDAVIVGAGFSGIYLLHRLRDELKMKVKIIEAGSDLGGVWHWNAYPGARVDCPAPVYAFGMEEIWRDWDWQELYPGQKELQAYFNHVDKVLSIRKDCIFNSHVNGASFNTNNSKWTIATDDERTVMAKYFVPAVGFAAQPYVPQWKGLDSFQGTIHHSSTWPCGGVDVRGKRVAIIGTGASGVQIVQEWGKEAAETFVFQRTPNLALPMRQRKLDKVDQSQMQAETMKLFDSARKTASGLSYEGPSKVFSDFSAEEREEALSQLYDEGGFRYWGGAYADLLINPEGNRVAYDFWAKKTRDRVHDPVKRDLLAPLNPPHPFGTKRPSLEQDYYEQFNKAKVHLVDTRAHPIVEITPKGLVTDDGTLYEVDVIAVATGFDAGYGGLAKMGIKDLCGVTLEDRWHGGVSTFLGLMVPGYPNMFLPYSVQAPTPFTNGPVFIEHQANFIRDVLSKMESESIASIDPQATVAAGWKAELQAIANMTLFPRTDSWYMGANVPTRAREMLYYFGGILRYRQICGETLDAKFAESFACVSC